MVSRADAAIRVVVDGCMAKHCCRSNISRGQLHSFTRRTFHPNYAPTAWQNNLCVFALVLIILAINATSTKPLIYIQMIAMIVLFLGWMPVAGCLGGLAPHPSFRETVTSFTSQGFSNIGIAVLVGQISNLYALTCM